MVVEGGQDSNSLSYTESEDIWPHFFNRPAEFVPDDDGQLLSRDGMWLRGEECRPSGVFMEIWTSFQSIWSSHNRQHIVIQSYQIHKSQQTQA